jgi:signal transduction histidine kinase
MDNINLVDNGLKFTKEKRGTISLGAETKDNPAVITIKDSGT